MRYIIVAPAYTRRSAGIVVLHELQKWLIRSGKDAMVMHFNDPFPIEDDDIVVYPEIICGNPLKAKRVVRYILNEPGKLGGDKNYDITEILVAYNPDFSKFSGDHYLEIPIIEDFFTNRGNERVIDCFWVGKGTNNNHPATSGSIEITYQWPATRRELAELLNRTRTFYCYDEKTHLLTEAMLCGCKTKLLRGAEVLDHVQVPPPTKDACNLQLQHFIQRTWYPEINPASDMAKHICERGVQLKAEQRYDEALTTLQLACKEGDTSGYAHMGDCLAQLGNSSDAETAYLDALKYDITDPRANTGIGVLKLLAGQAAPAIAAFSKVLKIEPDNSRALCGLGMARQLEGRPEIGFGYLVKACRADAENLTALTELIKASYALNRFDEAVRCTQNYLMYHPLESDLLFSLAGLFYKQGKFRDATNTIESLLIASPEYEGAAELMAKAAEELPT